MVRPAWVADPDAFSAGLVGDEVSCHTQAAGATRRLRGARTLVGNDWALFAEQQLLRAVGESGDALNAEIVFGGFIFQQILLSFFNAGQDRSFAGFVFVDANAQIDFVRARVGAENVGQTQNRIGRCSSDFFKHVRCFHGSELSRQKHQGSASYALCQPFARKTQRSCEGRRFSIKNEEEGDIGRIKIYA
ncbi:hypothetical protein D3C72_1712750 [compost metagenome]